jgi:hypothetical protein
MFLALEYGFMKLPLPTLPEFRISLSIASRNLLIRLELRTA